MSSMVSKAILSCTHTAWCLAKAQGNLHANFWHSSLEPDLANSSHLSSPELQSLLLLPSENLAALSGSFLCWDMETVPKQKAMVNVTLTTCSTFLKDHTPMSESSCHICPVLCYCEKISPISVLQCWPDLEVLEIFKKQDVWYTIWSCSHFYYINSSFSTLRKSITVTKSVVIKV